MSDSPETKIVEDALRLSGLHRSIIKAVIDGQAATDGFYDRIDDYLQLKKQIKMAIMDYPVIRVQDQIAQEILTRIATGQPFQVDRMMCHVFDVKEDSAPGINDELDFDEIKDMDLDLLYSWFGPHEYVQGLYEIGCLIVGLTVPEHLRAYVSEARQCYAFMKYNAVISLCRTILEVAARDRAARKRHFIKSGGNIIVYPSFGKKLIRMAISRGVLQDKFLALYTETSEAIHGHTVIDQGTAKRTFRETMSAVHSLYGTPVSR